jgi:hypothetical protein
MSFTASQRQGELPDYDLREFDDTAILTTDCEFAPRSVFREKEGNLPGASGATGGYGQILQVQTYKKALDITVSAEIVPDANGNAVGLANAYPGQAVTCAQFSAADDFSVHGFQRDAAKLLMVKDIKRTTNNEKVPVVAIPLTYYPEVLAA